MSLVGPDLLDRLAGSEGSVTARVRAGLKRDLEDLFNTNRRVLGWPAGLGELDGSLLDYGITDLATANLSTPQRRAAVVEELGHLIRAQEPRLRNMRIFALENADSGDRTLRIRIEGHVQIDAEFVPVEFNTLIDTIGNTILMTSPAP